MNLACGHEEGVVCAVCIGACVVALMRTIPSAVPQAAPEDCPRCDEARGQTYLLSVQSLDQLDRLGLLRRLAEGWMATRGPVATHIARRVLEVLDADEDRLMALRGARRAPACAGPAACVPTAEADQEDHVGAHGGVTRW